MIDLVKGSLDQTNDKDFGNSFVHKSYTGVTRLLTTTVVNAHKRGLDIM